MKYIKYLIVFSVVSLITTSCWVHEFPDDDPSYPLSVNVELEYNFVDIDFDNRIDVSTPFLRTSPNVLDCQVRYIVAIFDADKMATGIPEQQMQFVKNDLSHGAKIKLKLKPKKYTILTWVDYVVVDTDVDLLFKTTSFDDINDCFATYKANTDTKDAFASIKPLDLTKFIDPTANLSVKEVAGLYRPQGKYEIKSKGLKAYLEKYGDAKKPAYAIVSYRQNTVTKLNMVEDKVVLHPESVSFRSAITTINEDEFTLAFDWIFSLSNDNLYATIEIYTESDELINRVADVNVPIERNALTVLKANFLEAIKTEGGAIGIEDGFEDEIIIMALD